MAELYDIAILGAGPAGISAAIYAARARLNVIWLDKQYATGGQIINTGEVDNYPGLPGLTGFDLGETMGKHAEKLGLTPVRESVLSIENIETEENERENIIRTNKSEYHAKTLIAAFGAGHRKLGVPGEEEFSGMGVSYCATCDGAFFRDKTVSVVGGGNTAVGDAIILARFCKKVYLIHRRAELRADKILQENLFACENVETVWDSGVSEIVGNDRVTGIRIQNKKTGEETLLETDGVFVAVGITPNTEKLQNVVALDEAGYMIAGEDGITNVPGIFAAGDIRTKSLRQVVTAVSDGANAVNSAQEYLMKIVEK
ncbi:MAG: thioredoxin-disulfide reductase [Eubacteriales bacterium]|nr:thioredoxin-disulfide reductase [Eubacteriales bacterium]